MYKRSISLVLALIIVFGTFCFGAQAAANGTGYYVITASSLNMRSGAGSSYSKVTSIPKGVTVNVTKLSGVWGYTTYAGHSGWISLDYASKTSNYPDYSGVDVWKRLDELRVKFPDGKYWNHVGGTNNPDGWTDTPCSCHPSKCASTANACDCNVFAGTLKCHGFALKLGYDLFGTLPSTWEVRYTLDDICVGDIIRYRNNEHTVMVTGIGEDYLIVTDGNWDYHCGIDWDRWMSRSRFSNINYIYHAPGNNCKGPGDVTGPAVNANASADDYGMAQVSFSATDSSDMENATIKVTAPNGTYKNYYTDVSSGRGEMVVDLYDFAYVTGTYSVKVQVWDEYDNIGEANTQFTFSSVIAPDDKSVNLSFKVIFAGNAQSSGAQASFLSEHYDSITETAQYSVEGTPVNVSLAKLIYDFSVKKAGYTGYIHSGFRAGTDTVPSVITMYAGDVNDDNFINSKDISALVGLYGESKNKSGKYTVYADFNEDGYINARDMAVLIENYGKSGTTK